MAEFVSGVGNHYNKPDCGSFRPLEMFYGKRVGEFGTSG